MELRDMEVNVSLEGFISEPLHQNLDMKSQRAIISFRG